MVYLKPENYLYVMTKLTPADGSKPPFGVVSDFFDGLIESARNKEALTSQGQENQG